MADKLTLDVMAAKEAKMSYGQWMAMKYAQAAAPAQTPAVDRKLNPNRTSFCAYCGKPFERNKRHRNYCSSDCYDKQHVKRCLERYHTKRGGATE